MIVTIKLRIYIVLRVELCIHNFVIAGFYSHLFSHILSIPIDFCKRNMRKGFIIIFHMVVHRYFFHAPTLADLLFIIIINDRIHILCGKFIPKPCIELDQVQVTLLL